MKTTHDKQKGKGNKLVNLLLVCKRTDTYIKSVNFTSVENLLCALLLYANRCKYLNLQLRFYCRCFPTARALILIIVLVFDCYLYFCNYCFTLRKTLSLHTIIDGSWRKYTIHENPISSYFQTFVLIDKHGLGTTTIQQTLNDLHLIRNKFRLIQCTFIMIRSISYMSKYDR